MTELLDPPLHPGRVLRWCHPRRGAIVLGRAQPADHVDASRAGALGLDVVRRMSGGSAVHIAAGQQVWADVVIPAGDELWDDDVSRGAWWLGERWVEALTTIGVGGASVHRGPMVRGRWSDRVCFDSAAAGEVMIDGGKAVGVAQRRTRSAAMFQCAALIEWNPAPLADVLGIPVGDLGPCGVGVGGSVAALEAAFLGALGYGGSSPRSQ